MQNDDFRSTHLNNYLVSLLLCVHSAVVWLVFTAVRFAAFHDVLAFAVRVGIRLDTSPGFGAQM